VLVDTNVWSELTRPRPEPRVAAFLAANVTGCFLSTIVMAEMEFGIAKDPSPARRVRRRDWVTDIASWCEGRVLAPGPDAAAVWGRLKAQLEASGTLIADMDLLIASQAIAAGMPLVTRNISDMARTGAVIINPWEA
jgi:toxin FitB